MEMNLTYSLTFLCIFFYFLEGQSVTHLVTTDHNRQNTPDLNKYGYCYLASRSQRYQLVHCMSYSFA